MAILLILGVGILGWWLAHSYQQTRRRKAAEPVIASAISQHARTLYIQREQLKTVDPYGNVDYQKFFDHLGYFMENVIVRDLKERNLDTTFLRNKEYATSLSVRIGKAIVAEAEREQGDDLGLVKTGIEYELFCKKKLEQYGWSVRCTPVTGDQGADLIATKAGKTAVVQCKYYGQPVGNKAVQEAYAAKAFQKADFAVVVTNATFTPSAKQLALTNDVKLLHHLSFVDMDRLLGVRGSATGVDDTRMGNTDVFPPDEFEPRVSSPT